MRATDDSIATVSDEGGACVWKRNGSGFHLQMRLPEKPKTVMMLKFLEGGAIIVCGTDAGQATAYDVNTKLPMYQFSTGPLTGYESIVEAPGKSYFAIQSITTWDITSLEVRDSHTGRILFQRDNAVPTNEIRNAFSADGRYFVWGDFRQNAHILDIETLQDTTGLGTDGYLRTVCWSPDGSRFVTATDGGICKLWDTVTGAELLRLQGVERRYPINLQISPDGNILAATFNKNSKDSVEYLWDMR